MPQSESRLVPLLIASTLITACEGSLPTWPAAPGSASQPAVNAGAERAVPLRGQCETTFVDVAPSAGTDCDAFEATPSAFIDISGTCQISHLGRSTVQASQQLLFALDSNGNPVLVNGQPVVTSVRNCGRFTAANGDQLHHTAFATVTPSDLPGVVILEGGLSIRGGTGAFAAAAGDASLVGQANVLTHNGAFTLEGSLIR